MEYGFYLTKYRGCYSVRFHAAGDTQHPVKEVRLKKLAERMDVKINLDLKSPEDFETAERLCRQYIESGYLFKTKKEIQEKKSHNYVIIYLLDYWDVDGKRFALANKRRKNSISKMYCQLNRGFVKKYVVNYVHKYAVLDDIDNLFVREYQDYLLEKLNLKKSSINKIIRSLTIPLNYAFKTGMKKTPIVTEPLVEDDADLRGIFTPSEIVAIEKAYLEREKEGACPDARLCFVLATVTGMRMGEIIALTSDQINIINDFDALVNINKAWNYTDKIKLPKGKRERQVVIPANLATSLLEYAGTDPKKRGRVFWTNTEANTRSPNYFRNAFEKCCDDVGITKDVRKKRGLVFHSLRHTLSTRLTGLISNDLAMQTIGHTSGNVHDRYVHADYEMLKPVGDVTRKVFSGLKSLN